MTEEKEAAAVAQATDAVLCLVQERPVPIPDGVCFRAFGMAAEKRMEQVSRGEAADRAAQVEGRITLQQHALDRWVRGTGHRSLQQVGGSGCPN
ncbi:hypothetical protein Daci_1617 [Delftia acidovorans SPH-1]|uniref:Uncharacterized protein n=1 Tax=Delftia acidovorans (strain DSM 14801 / SPH-1) TaxID=398578 RepID=A9BYC2_DELAS|nr:hypothetical protein Daci_1617 [Delftia acidovorans SPH-1]